MTRKLNYRREKLNEDVEHAIEEFLNYANEPKTFGEIQAHLKTKKIVFKNADKDRSGLAHTLKRMIKQKRIKKIIDKTRPYPCYTTYSKSMFECALDGQMMKLESMTFMFMPDGARISDIDIESEFPYPRFSRREQLLRNLVTCLGVQTLYIILSSYSRTFNPKKSHLQNKINREEWLKNALSYHDPVESSLDAQIERRILEAYHFDENQFEIEPMLRKIASIKKQLKKIYPNITQNMITTENHLAAAKELSRDDYLTGQRYSILRE